MQRSRRTAIADRRPQRERIERIGVGQNRLDPHMLGARSTRRRVRFAADEYEFARRRRSLDGSREKARIALRWLAAEKQQQIGARPHFGKRREERAAVLKRERR